MSLKQRLEHRFYRWLDRRLPAVERIRLSHRSIFTFPSRAGFAFLGVLALLWLLATNYENNIVFAFGALLGAVMVVTIFHSYGNLAGLELRVLSVGEGFPGDRLKVEVEVSQRTNRLRDDLHLSFPDSESVRVALDKTETSAVVTLFVPAHSRGYRPLKRLTLETTYPLGLIRAWTHVSLRGAGVVYPRPVEGEASAHGDGGEEQRGESAVEGNEDFAGLDNYRPGESPNRIAWKQLARGQGVYTKHFADPVADPSWLDWEQYPGLDREARLSRLCHGVIKAAGGNQAFGLSLPGYRSALAQGDSHRDKLLRQLALFECDEVHR